MYRKKMTYKLYEYKIYGVELIDVRGFKATKSITAYCGVASK